VIVSARAEVLPLLDSLELDLSKLVEVVQYADGERALVTANDLKGFGPIIMNGRAVRGLRDMFCGERWESDEKDNQGGIRNPHNKIRVIHCNFDSNCCHPTKSPTNLTEKGAASRMKVASNQGWLPGFPIPDEQADAEYTTWVLGTHYDKDERELLAELSRPLKFARGRYTRFDERIVLLSGSEADPVRSERPEREGPTGIIDIPVARK
jgi:hypothetical protein